MIEKKRIAVTGANGQLGRSLAKLAPLYPALDIFWTDVDTLDICDLEAVSAFIKDNNIGYLVNCAAYTAVDKAEDDEAVCARINRDAVRNLGIAASCHGAAVVHISTDYVFNGKNYRPYLETDTPLPESVYGKTKEAGEKALQETCSCSLIIRTAWLYSEYGNNFVKTMLRLGKEREQLNVVFDQTGTPTYAGDLARAILEILTKPEFVAGIYHFSNEGVCSWYDFSTRIFRLSGLPCKALPIETKDYPTRATRPPYSVLNKAKIKQTYRLEIPHWEESLSHCLQELNNAK